DFYLGDLTLRNVTDLYLINAFMEAVNDKDQPPTPLETSPVRVWFPVRGSLPSPSARGGRTTGPGDDRGASDHAGDLRP
ncbi:hypothetical protein, partial [Streptomyces niveus]